MNDVNQTQKKKGCGCLTIFVVLFVLYSIGKLTDKKGVTEENKVQPKSNQEQSSVNPGEKAELENWLASGDWTCTNVLKGSAPFMRGAVFSFRNGRMVVSSGGTTVTNTYEIKGILNNVPEGSKYSALITINDKKDMLSRISENLMVLSWGGDMAKLQLRRR